MSSEAGPSKLRAPALAMLDDAELIKQGAEAVCPLFLLIIPLSLYNILILQRVYSVPSLYPAPSTYPSSTSSHAGPSVILKYRFPKTYRHPTLDAQLTKTRISFEARALARSLKAGIAVPKVLFVDERNGVLALEKIEGWSIREVLGGGAEGEEEDLEGEYEEGWEEAETKEEREEVVSEGLEALYRIGVSKGESVPHLIRHQVV
jgi:TP53 regulating kinase-like protein